MNVFISWSGPRSRAVALVLRDWLKCVLQSLKPWMSEQDLDRGSLWTSEINDQLRDAGVGIVCLTQANRTKPWILFEAGALAKGLSQARVCTLLIDLQPVDVEQPLGMFNHTLPTQESMLGLMKTLNTEAGEALDQKTLERVFNTYWPEFQEKFTEAVNANPETGGDGRRQTPEILEEVLEAVRSLTAQTQRLEDGVYRQAVIRDATRSPSTFRRTITPADADRAVELWRALQKQLSEKGNQTDK